MLPVQRDPTASHGRTGRRSTATTAILTRFCSTYCRRLRFEVVYQSTGAFLRRAGSGVSVISDKGYAFFHQTGTRFRMVACKFIPSVSRPGQLRDRLLLAGLRGLRRVSWALMIPTYRGSLVTC